MCVRSGHINLHTATLDTRYRWVLSFTLRQFYPSKWVPDTNWVHGWQSPDRVQVRCRGEKSISLAENRSCLASNLFWLSYLIPFTTEQYQVTNLKFVFKFYWEHSAQIFGFHYKKLKKKKKKKTKSYIFIHSLLFSDIQILRLHRKCASRHFPP
jgi:hypothetical protein